MCVTNLFSILLSNGEPTRSLVFCRYLSEFVGRILTAYMCVTQIKCAFFQQLFTDRKMIYPGASSVDKRHGYRLMLSAQQHITYHFQFRKFI